MQKHKTEIRRIVFGLFLLLVFSLGLMKPSFDTGFASLTPTDILFPLVFLCWIGGLATGSFRFRWHTEFWAFAIYLLALAISAIFSVKPGLSLIKLMGAGYLVLLAVMAASIATNLDRLKYSLLAWLAGSLLPLAAGLTAIILFYSTPESPWLAELTYHYGAVPVGNFPRISSTFVSASMFCNYLTVGAIFAIVSASLNWIGKRSAGVIISAIAICAVFTVSIALGGFILAVGLWFGTSSSHKLTRGAALVPAIAAAVSFLAMAPFALSLREGGSFFEQLQPSSRQLVWREAIGTFLSDPLTGSGVGTAVANVRFQNYDGSLSLLTDAHNIFLSVAAQSGILGLLAIVCIIVVTLRAALIKRAGLRETEHLRRGLAIAFGAAFVYQGLTGSFEDARHLWILIGLIIATKNLYTASTSLNSAK